MTRFVNSANQTAAQAAAQSMGILASLDFTSGFVRATNRTHDVTFGGFTYTGVGQLGTVEGVAEDTELRPSPIRITISGVDNSLLSKALGEDYHGRVARVYVGWFNEDNSLKADPEQVFKGYMDHMLVTLGEHFGSITVICENEWARWARPKPLLYTQETQAVFYAGDNIFDQVPHLKNKIVQWGGHNIDVPQESDNIRPGGRPRNRFDIP